MILKTSVCVCMFCVGIMAKTVLKNNLKKKNECLSGITSEPQTLLKEQFRRMQMCQL